MSSPMAIIISMALKTLGLCKVRLAKFRGIKKDTFYLHIKECEFRSNNRKKSKNELYLFTLKLIKNYNKKKMKIIVS